MKLLEVVLVLVLVGVLIAASVGATEAAVSARQSGDASYARRVGESVLAAVLAEPYGASYDVSGVPNPRGWPVVLEVLWYGPGAEPAFAPGYPDSGLQLVRVRVNDPGGRERACLEVLKAR